MRVCHKSMAVSYTHLDVYKRQDNWTPEEKFLKNACGPNNVWQNNGPQVADEIVKKAGKIKE